MALLRRKPRRGELGRARQRRIAEPSAAPSYNFRSGGAASEAPKPKPNPTPSSKKKNSLSDNGLLQRTIHVVLLIAIVASVINILTLSSNAKILPLTSGNDDTFLHDQSVYQQAADKLLAKSFWNHNKLTINTSGVCEQLLKQFPELSDASVTLPLLAHRPIIYIQPSQPVLVMISNGGTFVVDETGKALLNINQLPNGKDLELPLVTDQSGVKVSIDQQVLSSKEVSFIQTVVSQIAAKHLSIGSITLPAHAGELDVAIAGQPYFVKFNLEHDDPRQQAGTFLAVISQGIVPPHYIDVRVDGRAYYQ